MAEIDQRLDRMIELADETGYTLDQIVKAVGRIDQSTFDAVSESPSLLPRYIQSSVRP
jgi:methyl-accepting chemotaxis protein